MLYFVDKKLENCSNVAFELLLASSGWKSASETLCFYFFILLQLFRREGDSSTKDILLLSKKNKIDLFLYFKPCSRCWWGSKNIISSGRKETQAMPLV